MKDVVSLIRYHFLDNILWNVSNALDLYCVYLCSLFQFFHSIIHPFTHSDNISQSTTTPTNVTRKKSTKKSPKKDSQNVNTSYEHHLEKWLENTAKMNFDYNTIDLNLPFLTTPSSYQQLPQNRNSNLQQYGSADPISLPSHFVSWTIKGIFNFFFFVLF